MKTSRRDLLRGAALSGVVASAAALPGCLETEKSPGSAGPAKGESGVSLSSIAEAEKLQNLSYTNAEREQALGHIESQLETLARLRAATFSNADAPALLFDPRLPGKSVGSQKNRLTLVPRDTAPVPSDASDIAYASLADLGAWLRAGALSSAELTEIYLTRIQNHDDALHAFITVTPEIARAQAQKADEDFAKGRDRGPLHGIPFGMKDIVDTKNIPTTWGSGIFRDRVPPEDAEITRKLQRAGAVLLGKTSCGEIAYGDLWFEERTRNPWNTEEGSSGSSAGSAAATAAGLCAFSIGTETLGSIVSPSERCGAAGLRPTFGRVSRAGVMTLAWTFDKVGPICRYAEDTALVLSELNGYDADDPYGARVGFSYDASADLSAMSVGYSPAWFEAGDAIDRAALEALKELGVQVREFNWPSLDIDSMINILDVEAAAAFQELTLTDRDDDMIWQANEAWPNLWRSARFVSAVDFVQMSRLRRRLMQALEDAFVGFDALIGPHFGGGGQDVLLATNLTGHPQLVVRAGFAQTATRQADDDEPGAGPTFRTPRGISLWADLFQEGKIIALGTALEQHLGAAEERPPTF
ncbi:MAG: amidase [Pseudomonadota bacterium]